MFKIGDFAKRSGVTVKTLRHYDQIGLLKPAHVDEDSGYRYYTAEQLLTLRRIAGFKEHGFTLEMIKQLLDGSLPMTKAECTLIEKRRELESRIREAEKQLRGVDQRLIRIESQAAAAEDGTLSVRGVAPALVASIRGTVPEGQLCLLLDELQQYVSSQGEEPDRELTIVWHKRAVRKEDPSDIEVAIPVSKPIASSRRVTVHLLPGIETAASYIHHCDPYSDECKANGLLRAWLADAGYRPLDGAPVREMYLTPDRDMYGQLRKAEALIPVQRL